METLKPSQVHASLLMLLALFLLLQGGIYEAAYRRCAGPRVARVLNTGTTLLGVLLAGYALWALAGQNA